MVLLYWQIVQRLVLEFKQLLARIEDQDISEISSFSLRTPPCLLMYMYRGYAELATDRFYSGKILASDWGLEHLTMRGEADGE